MTLRVLLVDDEAPLRAALADLLRDEGIAVAGEAWDGPTAVTGAVRLEPDVVVMDLRMPGLGGIAVTRMLRSLGLPLRIVLLSAYDDDALKAEADAAGADAYLVKGCSAAELLDAVAGAVPSSKRGVG